MLLIQGSVTKLIVGSPPFLYQGKCDFNSNTTTLLFQMKISSLQPPPLAASTQVIQPASNSNLVVLPEENVGGGDVTAGLGPLISSLQDLWVLARVLPQSRDGEANSPPYDESISFFEPGGDSISAMQLSVLFKQDGISVDVQDI
ncbi:MAG: hypothetical protein M1834_009551 [Cirrosporium novae-zelandiae]|nr:MAG: hypothetical protein M1834_009551 [Cirrosporium novae-zelandiae]